jgi:hypothetical protein
MGILQRIGAIKINTVLRVVGTVGWLYMAFTCGRCYEDNQNECRCGQERACAFGPGIVGKQECDVDRTWDKCRPDPRYLMPEMH